MIGLDEGRQSKVGADVFGGVLSLLEAFMVTIYVSNSEGTGRDVAVAAKASPLWSGASPPKLGGAKRIRNQRWSIPARIEKKYPVGESNPCLRRERALSWATRRTGRSDMDREFSALMGELSIACGKTPLLAPRRKSSFQRSDRPRSLPPEMQRGKRQTLSDQSKRDC